MRPVAAGHGASLLSKDLQDELDAVRAIFGPRISIEYPTRLDVDRAMLSKRGQRGAWSGLPRLVSVGIGHGSPDTLRWYHYDAKATPQAMAIITGRDRLQPELPPNEKL